MAYVSGTATDYLDLFERFRTFITSHPTLVAAGQNWAELRYSTTEAGTGRRVLMLRGPGNSGTDQIYVNIHTDFNVIGDWYNWHITGAAGYNPATAYNDQPGQSTGAAAAGHDGFWLRLWNSAVPGASNIPYWFIADGRFFKIIAKVSTSYQHMCGGFILPYATPNEYPYPLYIGAMGESSAFRWSETSNQNWAYWRGYYSSAHRWIDGAWLKHRTVQSNGGIVSTNAGSAEPLIWPKCSRISDGTGYDGSYRLVPLHIYHYYGANAATGSRMFGMLPGIFHVTGYQNASENVLTIGGKNYLVIQNSYLTGAADYAAFLLE